jgi:hypothetical protein
VNGALAVSRRPQVAPVHDRKPATATPTAKDDRGRRKRCRFHGAVDRDELQATLVKPNFVSTQNEIEPPPRVKSRRHETNDLDSSLSFRVRLCHPLRNLSTVGRVQPRSRLPRLLRTIVGLAVVPLALGVHLRSANVEFEMELLVERVEKLLRRTPLRRPARIHHLHARRTCLDTSFRQSGKAKDRTRRHRERDSPPAPADPSPDAVAQREDLQRIIAVLDAPGLEDQLAIGAFRRWDALSERREKVGAAIWEAAR